MRTRGEGVKNPEHFADVLYEWSLVAPIANVPRMYPIGIRVTHDAAIALPLYSVPGRILHIGIPP